MYSLTTSTYIDQVNDELVAVQDFPNLSRGCLWENSQSDKGIFVAYDNDTIYSYIYSKHTMQGQATTLSSV